jgi:WD40 repeat protein
MDNYDDETEIMHKLTTEYDFAEANNATAKTLQKLKEAEGVQDDFEDDFGDYSEPQKNDAGNKEKGDQQYQVTSVNWSCNGAALAVAYGKTDHVSWCEHQSIINIWSIFRRNFNAKKPIITIEAPNCVSTISFHPKDPSILAAGTINGEIFIWRLNDGDEKGEQAQLLSKSEADEYFHREPIQKIVWTI